MAEAKRRRTRCASCQTFFEARNSRAKYCSDECRNRARRGTRGQTPPPKKRRSTKRGGLTVVGPNDQAPAEEASTETKDPKNVEAAAASDDPLDLLVALRIRIARAIDNPTTPPRDLAALSRQQLLIAQHIEALKAAGEEDPVGEAGQSPDEEFDPSGYGTTS